MWSALWTLIGGFMTTGAGLVVTRALAGMGAAMRSAFFPTLHPEADQQYTQRYRYYRFVFPWSR
jgi:hypothetical protein